MKDLLFLTPAEARYGFRLAGVRQTVLEAKALEETLLREIDGESTGVIVIDERLLTELEPDRLRELERRWPGVLVVLPAPEPEPGEGEDYALRVVRQALGYQMRLTS